MVYIVCDKYCLQVAYNDPHGHFIVVEINNDGNVIWLVGIYAPNHVVQYIVLWDSLLDISGPTLIINEWF